MLTLDKEQLLDYLTSINPDSNSIDGTFIDTKEEEDIVDSLLDEIIDHGKRTHTIAHNKLENPDDCKGPQFYIVESMKAYLINYYDKLSIGQILGVVARVYFSMGRAEEGASNPLGHLLGMLPPGLKARLMENSSNNNGNASHT